MQPKCYIHYWHADWTIRIQIYMTLLNMNSTHKKRPKRHGRDPKIPQRDNVDIERGGILNHFFSLVTPTTTLLTSFPLLSRDIGFSTTTVWVIGLEDDGSIPVGSCIGIGVLMLAILMFVTNWQRAHLTEGAPKGYMSIVRQFPQLTWAKPLPGARFSVWQQEHLTLAAPPVYINNVRQPPHIRWATPGLGKGGGYAPGGSTGVTVLHTAQRTLVAPLG